MAAKFSEDPVYPGQVQLRASRVKNFSLKSPQLAILTSHQGPGEMGKEIAFPLLSLISSVQDSSDESGVNARSTEAKRKKKPADKQEQKR